VRIHFDRHGRVRGYSASGREVYLAQWVWLLFLPITAVVYYFPRAVWGTRLDPIAKVAIIAIAWGGVAIAGT
jgi:hypothetical protein